ncbi:MAG: CBS domain-containing protein [Candidatus Binatia bacterium]
MQIKEIMTRGIEAIQPEATIQEAAEKMRMLDIGVIPVCENGQLLGMLTDRDITVRATAGGSDPAEITVREVMTPDIICCFEDQDVEEAASLMEERQIRRLLVLTRDKQMVGMVSIGDLALCTNDQKLAGQTLGQVSANRT